LGPSKKKTPIGTISSRTEAAGSQPTEKGQRARGECGGGLEEEGKGGKTCIGNRLTGPPAKKGYDCIDTRGGVTREEPSKKPVEGDSRGGSKGEYT